MTPFIPLVAWITESNRIEGIHRSPLPAEIEAHEIFLLLPRVTVADLQAFVSAVQQGAVLRDKKGLDVQVGNHLPPFGGPAIVTRLNGIITDLAVGSPYDIHIRYETLHPFMDGNGRSGRVLWLWMIKQRAGLTRALNIGFLHSWYYQSLDAA